MRVTIAMKSLVHRLPWFRYLQFVIATDLLDLFVVVFEGLEDAFKLFPVLCRLGVLKISCLGKYACMSKWLGFTSSILNFSHPLSFDMPFPYHVSLVETYILSLVHFMAIAPSSGTLYTFDFTT